ncbi:MAG: hypothetical protein GY866_22680 [Proteobacteria bacterium]|nr:hypothetical protein [Pseudomonadota bacterium]
MKKMKKHERVEKYLKDLVDIHGYSIQKLRSLKYKDLVGAPELEGIGERTISNSVKSFKQTLGSKSVKEKATKKSKVDAYLDRMLETGSMALEELATLKLQDLMNVEELKDIGKTTIACSLNSFKKKHESKNFEDSILNFIEIGNTVPNLDQKPLQTAKNQKPNLANPPVINGLNNFDMKLLREMINDFKRTEQRVLENKTHELRELKLALHFMGIDAKTIIEHYRSNILDNANPSVNTEHHFGEAERYHFFETA